MLLGDNYCPKRVKKKKTERKNHNDCKINGIYKIGC